MHSAAIIAFWQTGLPTPDLLESGLIATGDLKRVAALEADARAIVEKARDQFGASHVFLRSRPGRPMVPEALVFDNAQDNGGRSDQDFATLHRRLWSWGAVPLVYRRLAGRVDVFRCAHEPDFDTGKEQPKYSPHGSLDLIKVAADITGLLEEKPWWDMRRLANGTLWDDREVAKQFLSDKSAHKTILRQVEALDRQLSDKSHLAANLRRRLLIISLLVAYLEDRDVFRLESGFFDRFKSGATKFHHVLSDAEALIELLKHLETERFNGNVFRLEDKEKEQLLKTTHLKKFAELIEGTTEKGGQQTLWRLYSFRDLPVELISHIYQLFVEDKTTCVYTPPFLARLMLEEALTLDRMDRLEERNEIVFDPSCGSGVFLVEAFKRLVLHWRKNNGWAQPPVDVLRKLMRRVRGTDVDGYAVELAAFSLCLAMCEELPAQTINKARKLFPTLNGETLIETCFFQQAREKKLPRNIGVVVGNPPFGSASKVGTTEQAYNEYLDAHGNLPDRQSGYLFLHHSMEALVEDGLLCLIQKDNFLYNRRSAAFRRAVFERWDVRQIMDFTPIRGLFFKDPKVVVVMAEARAPKPKRSILHAIFRRTVHTQAELSFELDYYDMQWVPRDVATAKDFVWRCNLFGGGRTVSLVERLKKLPTLKDFIKQRKWEYGEGFKVGTPTIHKVVPFLHNKPFISANAVVVQSKPTKQKIWPKTLVLTNKPNVNAPLVGNLVGTSINVSAASGQNSAVAFTSGVGSLAVIKESLIKKQPAKYFYRPTKASLFKAPIVVMPKLDSFVAAYWDKSDLAFDSRLVGVSLSNSSDSDRQAFRRRLQSSLGLFRCWIALTSSSSGLQHATDINKSDIDGLPFPADEADLDLTENDQIILNDAFDYYRDFQRLGDDAEMMREVKSEDHKAFAEVFTRQINVVHKKLKALPVQTWAGVSCQPFSFGEAEPDWKNAAELEGKLAQLLRTKKSPSLAKVRILRVFDGPFVFLIKPNRLRYWLRSIALRDADEALADLRALGF